MIGQVGEILANVKALNDHHKIQRKNIFDIGVNSVLIENGNDQSIIKRITNEINKLKEKTRHLLYR